ncbi:hypothetical protein O6H91_06G141800 [Diphasiastrum complanatum]|uniref:Uncharacterized protein n=1 Tax=Diphasiastrum complanatum TaxID=34168 RepID=A0ACC2DJW1_DIPCM|nr:hypothetical protein O6H91_06G141800 [Diphasiastrum complanatum]
MPLPKERPIPCLRSHSNCLWLILANFFTCPLAATLQTLRHLLICTLLADLLKRSKPGRSHYLCLRVCHCVHHEPTCDLLLIVAFPTCIRPSLPCHLPILVVPPVSCLRLIQKPACPICSLRPISVHGSAPYLPDLRSSLIALALSTTCCLPDLSLISISYTFLPANLRPPDLRPSRSPPPPAHDPTLVISLP